MNNYIVWLDSNKAHVFALKTSGVDKEIVKKSGKDLHRRHKHDKSEDDKGDRYYKELATHLKDADQLLILGPGTAKHHFKEHLTSHQANKLAEKIIGLENFESFEHKTEKQMMDFAHRFFKKYDVFNAVV